MTAKACEPHALRLGGMPTVLGGHVLATTTNMATKTWPCHPTEEYDESFRLKVL